MEEKASAVGEVGWEDPIEEPEEERAVAEWMTAEGKKEVMCAEGRSPPQVLPQPEQEDDELNI